MALAAFNGQVQDLRGNALANVSVEVRRAVPGQPKPRLYSDRDGTVPLGNPFALDPGDNGHFRFHVQGGAYRIRAYDGRGFEKIWDYVPIGTAAEYDVPGDEQPFPLTQNVDAGYALKFETETSAPPSPGAIRFNHADLSQATEAYVSAVNLAGSDISARVAELFNALRSVKDSILLTNAATNKQASFRVDGVTPDNTPANYFTVAVSGHAGETEFPAEVINLQRERAGADGAMVGPASSTAGNIATFGDSSGGVLVDSGIPAGSAATLFGAIKQNATETATGVVEKATAAEVQGATSDKFLSADHLQSASSPVALTDAATVAIDWKGGINFTLTLTANRALGNPSNGIPGTWRTVLVQGDSGTTRTLTFGNQYGGELPVLTDITSTKKYLLTLYCKSASQFLVTAINGSDA